MDEVLVCTDNRLEYISQKLGIQFEETEGQCGPLKDCLITIDEEHYVYISKWEYERENYTRFNSETLSSERLQLIFDMIKEILDIKQTNIEWLNSKIQF